MKRKGDLAINSTFLFVLALVMLLLLVVFYIYLKGKGITLIEGGIKLPT
jgi:hypothetical protein